MNPRPHLKKAYSRGFALIVTLSLMVLLTVLSVGLLTMSSVSVRSSSRSDAMATAQANARLALMLAIGDLQKAAGPDQRVTAAADILPTAQAPAAGRARWAGVWDTSAYSPATPNNKTFIRWLTSGNQTTIAAAGATPGATDVQIFEGANAASSVRVPKVTVDRGAYAYWVEDEGLKADLGWNEASTTDSTRKQAARLSAAPGPDYGVFDGPFAGAGKIKYPITTTAGNPWLGELGKALSPADMPLVMGDSSAQTTWLQANRHDITLGSRGVMADVKKGGLRRDLSLAFEMDGTKDVSATQQPTNFNQQVGEFVGGSDRRAGQQNAPGMPVRERFLYRVTKDDGSPFSGNLKRADSVVRGPNWWAMRDYYNLYKRLETSGGRYRMQPRAYYPNNDPANTGDSNYAALFHYSSPTANFYDDERNADNKYVFHPARANYAPILLGTVNLYSVRISPTSGNLALVIDPMIYLWNPYNITLNVPRYGVSYHNGHGGQVIFQVQKKTALGANDGTPIQYGPARIDAFIQQKVNSSYNQNLKATYLASNLTMTPGEVMIVSPKSPRTDPTATEFHDEATPGTNLTSASGIECDQIPRMVWNPTWRLNPDGTYTGRWENQGWDRVVLNPTDEVRCLFTIEYGGDANGNLTDSANAFWIESFLPNDSTVQPGNIVDARTNTAHLQTIGGNLAGRSGGGMDDHYDQPSASNPATWPNVTGAEIAVTAAGPSKSFFGINSLLLKPSNHSNPNTGGAMPNRHPVEIFSQFNPFRMASFSEGHRVCHFNETYSAVSKKGVSINSYIQDVGIQFPATSSFSGYWGQCYNGAGGSTAVPFIDIPTSPIFSLADFANANLSLRASEPYKKVGNSHASIFVPSSNLYAQPGINARPTTVSDACWLINDALFDRYYLSGIAPDFTIRASGYSATGSILATLTSFFSANYQDANANPVLRPYLPNGTTSTAAVDALEANNGYKKMGAYSLIDGAFNVNSTSVKAWEALLRANRNLTVTHSDNGSNSSAGTPFPSGALPANPAGAAAHWSGLSRLSDAEITTLAGQIVTQVRLRGPFMSLSDFVNRQLSANTQVNAAGALQAALDTLGATATIKANAGGIQPVDPATGAYSNSTNFPGDANLTNRKSTEGIAGDIRQADLLRSLAPRLSARSDTFRIRAYGEARDASGTIIAKATCEAVVQRVPEYVDPTTNAVDNEPWDEDTNPDFNTTNPNFNAINRTYGRRFVTVGFRWLTDSEI